MLSNNSSYEDSFINYLPNHTKLSRILRRTFAELSRKYPYPQTPAISRGCIRGKANTRGLGVWLSQSLTFGSLAAAFGACFLKLQKATFGSTSGRCKDVLQDHGIWRCHSTAGPPGRQEVVALTSCNIYNDNPIGSMYAIYGNIYHQYTPNVSIYTIHGSYGNDP